MKNILRRILIYLKSLIHLSDEIDYENASASIRKNIAFKGTNVFILACVSLSLVVPDTYPVISKMRKNTFAYSISQHSFGINT